MLGDTVGYSQEHLTPFNVKCRTELFESFNPQQLAASLLQQGKRSEGIAFMLVPPLLARFNVARLEDNVKGCTLGVREIDPHVEVFRRFGGVVERAEGSLLIRSEGRLTPTDHWLDYASVTTTENFVLCAASAGGTSTLTNAASEPHGHRPGSGRRAA